VRLLSFVDGGDRRANYKVALQVSLFAMTPNLLVITLHNTFVNGMSVATIRGAAMALTFV
jgi:hypothetical protein